MLVSEAISRVRNYLDDQNNGSDARWSDAEIKTSLQLSLDLLVAEAVQMGVHQGFRKTTTSTLSNGEITVPEHFKIISLFYSTGNTRTAIYPCGARNRNFIDKATSGVVELDYIAKNNVDWSNNSATVTYGTVDVKNALWDAYLATLAALDLTVKEGEAAGILQNRSDRYRMSLFQTPTTGQVSVFPQSRNILSPSSYYQLYYYEKAPTTLEVYR